MRPFMDDYTQLFLEVYRRMERWLLRALVVFGALLILAQLLLQIPYVRGLVVKVEQLEGKPFAVDFAFATSGELWYNQ